MGWRIESTKCSGELGLSNEATWKSKYLFSEDIY